MNATQLQAYRERIFNQLKDAGLPVTQWQEDLDAKIASTPAEQRRRPFSTDVKFESPTIPFIPAGFEEFRLHPAHGKPIRRCMARHPDGNQCGRFALKDRRICRRHSAGTRHKPDSQRGQHWNEGKGENREARRARSEAAKQLRELERQMVAQGFTQPAMRGPRPGTAAEAYAKHRAAYCARLSKTA